MTTPETFAQRMKARLAQANQDAEKQAIEDHRQSDWLLRVLKAIGEKVIGPVMHEVRDGLNQQPRLRARLATAVHTPRWPFGGPIPEGILTTHTGTVLIVEGQRNHGQIIATADVLEGQSQIRLGVDIEPAVVIDAELESADIDVANHIEDSEGLIDMYCQSARTWYEEELMKCAEAAIRCIR